MNGFDAVNLKNNDKNLPEMLPNFFYRYFVFINSSNNSKNNMCKHTAFIAVSQKNIAKKTLLIYKINIFYYF
jgi:hypothetical protein